MIRDNVNKNAIGCIAQAEEASKVNQKTKELKIKNNSMYADEIARATAYTQERTKSMGLEHAPQRNNLFKKGTMTFVSSSHNFHNATMGAEVKPLAAHTTTVQKYDQQAIEMDSITETQALPAVKMGGRAEGNSSSALGNTIGERSTGNAQAFGDLVTNQNTSTTPAAPKRKLTIPKKSKQLVNDPNRPNTSYAQAKEYLDQLDQLHQKREKVKNDLARMNIVKGKDNY